MLRWILGLLITSPLWFGIALYAASEYGGEVVELETFDERGNALKTRLWVVDIHEESWLRAGDPEATWLKRLEKNPEVILVRDGERLPLVATLWDDGPDRINYMMREKYGYADQIVSLIHDPAAVVTVRLIPPES